MKNGRVLIRYSWVFLALLWIIAKGVIPGWNNTGTDFNNYYSAARLLIEQEPLDQFYDNDWFNQQAKFLGIENGAKFSPFPPLTALLYLPLTFWDFLTAKRIWLVFNLLLLGILPFRLKKWFDFSLPQSLLLISIFCVPLASNLNFGQAYLWISFLLLESVGYFLKTQRTTIPSLILAFCTGIKYVPVLFMGYLLQSRKYRPLLYFTLFLTGFALIPVLLEPDVYAAFFEIGINHFNGDLSGQGKFAIGFQSMDALFNLLFVPDATHNPTPFLAIPWLKPPLKLVVFLIVGTMLYLLFKRDRFQLNPENTSIAIFGAFVLLPASASYHFTLLILPALLLLQAISHPTYQLIFLLGLLFTFSVQYHHIPHFPNVPTWNTIIHFPRFWGMTGLFSFLFFLKTRRING